MRAFSVGDIPLWGRSLVDASAGTGKTYAIATLSSVWGSSWAMTAITNVGFSAVILMGAAGYALTGAVYLIARRLGP